ncbi:MAG TPA: hypothetical protein VMC61_02895, partial [Methanocella sp.]|nr:hypothetical protein [Methanocella sp.]
MQGSTVIRIFAAAAALVLISALALMVYRSGGAALIWQMGGEDPVLKFYPAAGGLYVISASNVSLVDGTGRALWTVPFPGTQYSALGEGGLYVYSADRGLNVIYPNGSIKTLAMQGMNYPPIVGADGTLYLRSWGLLSAMDPSGGLRWNVTNVVSDPVIDRDGNVYFFMRPPDRISDVYLYCMGPNGSARWSTYYGKYYASISLKPARTGGVFVYDEPTGIFYHLDSDGTMTWDHTMTYLGEFNLVEDEKDRLYLFYQFGTVHMVNEDGVLLGKYNPVITYNANLSYKPAAFNDTVYVAGDSGKDSATLYALNLDGTLKWERQFNSSAAPVIYTGKDIVCVGTGVRSDSLLIPVLYVIDGRGQLKFTYNSGDGRPWEQVYVGPDDTVYAKTYG